MSTATLLELRGRLISVAARMVRLDGGCEGGHKAGRWHMHEEPYHGTGRELATIAHSWQQLTRVGDEERLRAALQDAYDEMLCLRGPDETEERHRLATLDDLAAALAPQPPSPASQGGER